MKNNILKYRAAILLVLSSLTAVPVFAASGAVNVDKHGLAIKGYDPVAYFKDGKAEKGKAEFQSTYSGATYQFASQEHKALFDKEPAKYVPEYGGYCAYGLSQGHKAPVDPQAWTVVDGKLYLNYAAGVRSDWQKDKNGLIKKADAYWPRVKDQN